MLNALKTLLLFALLAITGEAAAVHCGSGGNALTHGEAQIAEREPVVATASTAEITDTDRAHTVSHAEPCSHGQCEDAHTASATHQDCDGSCSCCPGLCTNVIPASVSIAEFHSFHLSLTTYRPLDSTPAPESTIRPPILA